MTVYIINIWKFAIAIIWDILDFTLFRIPGIGTFTDILAIPVAIWLWGPAGIIAIWEVADFSDQLDAEVPTMTTIGVLMLLGGSKR